MLHKSVLRKVISMKKSFAVLVSTVAIVVIGCNQESKPGGPGVTNTPSTSVTTANRPTYGEAEKTFELSVPTLATRLSQGETKAVTISVSRGKNFDQDVTLKFDGVPQGITVDPAAPAIKHGDKEAKLTLHAAPDAALGDFSIGVAGHPSKGPDATTKMNLTVVAP